MSQDPALQALQHRSLLTKVLEQLAVVGQHAEQADKNLLQLEASIQAKHIFLEHLRLQVQALESEQAELQRQRAAAIDTLEGFSNQKAMLRDLLSLLRGELFQESEKGALFFTHSLQDFASFYGEGPLTVEAAIGRSSDGFSFSFQGKTFVYVKGGKTFYLHPEAVDPAALLHSQ